MLKNRPKYLPLLLFFIFSSSSLCLADWGFRNTYEFSYALSEKLELDFQTDSRLDGDIGNFYYYHFQPGITYHINNFFDFGFSCRYIKKEKAKEGKDI